MTIIAALRTEKGVWMGADAMCTDTRYSFKTMAEMVMPKVIEVGDAFVGLAGEHIVHTVVRHHKPPAPKAGESTVLWLQQRLLPWIEKTLKKLDPRKDSYAMLVARGNELFWVEEDNVDAIAVDSYAIGTGGPYALGAMSALAGPASAWSPDQVVLAAVKAACTHDPFCGGRIDLFTTAPS